MAVIFFYSGEERFLYLTQVLILKLSVVYFSKKNILCFTHIGHEINISGDKKMSMSTWNSFRCFRATLRPITVEFVLSDVENEEEFVILLSFRSYSR